MPLELQVQTLAAIATTQFNSIQFNSIQFTLCATIMMLELLQNLAATDAIQFNSHYVLLICCRHYNSKLLLLLLLLSSIQFTLCATIMPLELQVQTLTANAATQFNSIHTLCY